MIEVQNLSKSYGDIKVLHNLSMRFEEGRIYGLIGQSGCGKSTLLRCINGLTPYNEGSLTVNGVEVCDLSDRDLREFRKNIGMIFQHFSLLNRLNVYDNIALPLECWGYSKEEISNRVLSLLDMVHLSEKRYAFPKELSGGQKQRVAIARALALNPKILLCDEATSALDPNIAQTIMELLVEINQSLGITILVVTHQFSIVKRYCEEVFILEKGRIAANGSCSDIFLEPPSSLQTIASETDQIIFPNTGITIHMILPDTVDSQTIVSQMCIDTGIPCKIISVEKNDFFSKSLYSVIINVSKTDCSSVVSYLDKKKIIWNIKGGEITA